MTVSLEKKILSKEHHFWSTCSEIAVFSITVWGSPTFCNCSPIVRQPFCCLNSLTGPIPPHPESSYLGMSSQWDVGLIWPIRQHAGANHSDTRQFPEAIAMQMAVNCWVDERCGSEWIGKRSDLCWNSPSVSANRRINWTQVCGRPMKSFV